MDFTLKSDYRKKRQLECNFVSCAHRWGFDAFCNDLLWQYKASWMSLSSQWVLYSPLVSMTYIPLAPVTAGKPHNGERCNESNKDTLCDRHEAPAQVTQLNKWGERMSDLSLVGFLQAAKCEAVWARCSVWERKGALLNQNTREFQTTGGRNKVQVLFSSRSLSEVLRTQIQLHSLYPLSRVDISLTHVSLRILLSFTILSASVQPKR